MLCDLEWAAPHSEPAEELVDSGQKVYLSVPVLRMTVEETGICSESFRGGSQATRPSQRKPRRLPVQQSGPFGWEAGAEGGALPIPKWHISCPPSHRILEVPYAYQCCAYGICAGFFKASGQWEAEDFHLEEEEAPKRPLGLLAGHVENHCEWRGPGRGRGELQPGSRRGELAGAPRRGCWRPGGKLLCALPL